jgi:hypothetical protein
MVLAVAALLVLIVTPAAVAINKRCDEKPCFGTSANDRLRERQGNGVADKIYGLKAKDRIRAGRYGSDRDRVYGNKGSDRLVTADGDQRDRANGGPGFDVCLVDSGDRYRGCEMVVGV